MYGPITPKQELLSWCIGFAVAIFAVLLMVHTNKKGEK